ncbi:hypothetical protein K438DRAFT_1943904 [Mycena galopus ATCC 62051]|nr:hypothetical protein K438DRAFT_1943904 [Mycena galopus ATCC 62051]
MAWGAQVHANNPERRGAVKGSVRGARANIRRQTHAPAPGVLGWRSRLGGGHRTGYTPLMIWALRSEWEGGRRREEKAEANRGGAVASNTSPLHAHADAKQASRITWVTDLGVGIGKRRDTRWDKGGTETRTYVAVMLRETEGQEAREEIRRLTRANTALSTHDLQRTEVVCAKDNRTDVLLSELKDNRGVQACMVIASGCDKEDKVAIKWMAPMGRRQEARKVWEQSVSRRTWG